MKITRADGTLFSPPVWSDFQNLDWDGRVKLTSPGTTRQLDELKLQLRPSLELVLFDEDADRMGVVDDLVTLGVVEFDDEEVRWVATISWNDVCHVSELDAEDAEAYRRFRPQSVGKVDPPQRRDDRS